MVVLVHEVSIVQVNLERHLHASAAGTTNARLGTTKALLWHMTCKIVVRIAVASKPALTREPTGRHAVQVFAHGRSADRKRCGIWSRPTTSACLECEIRNSLPLPPKRQKAPPLTGQDLFLPGIHVRCGCGDNPDSGWVSSQLSQKLRAPSSRFGASRPHLPVVHVRKAIQQFTAQPFNN